MPRDSIKSRADLDPPCATREDQSGDAATIPVRLASLVQRHAAAEFVEPVRHHHQAAGRRHGRLESLDHQKPLTVARGVVIARK
jgi:hypothetical protein